MRKKVVPNRVRDGVTSAHAAVSLAPESPALLATEETSATNWSETSIWMNKIGDGMEKASRVNSSFSVEYSGQMDENANERRKEHRWAEEVVESSSNDDSTIIESHEQSILRLPHDAVFILPQAPPTPRSKQLASRKRAANGTSRRSSKAKRIRRTPSDRQDKGKQPTPSRFGRKHEEDDETEERTAVTLRAERKEKLGYLQNDTLKCCICLQRVHLCGPNVKAAANVFEPHPVLHVACCCKCARMYSTEMTTERFEPSLDGNHTACTWCACGGQLILCDKCPRAFCRKCLRTQLGRAYFTRFEQLDENEVWRCLVCEPPPELLAMQASTREALEAVTRECDRFRERRVSKTNQLPPNVGSTSLQADSGSDNCKNIAVSGETTAHTNNSASTPMKPKKKRARKSIRRASNKPASSASTLQSEQANKQLPKSNTASASNANVVPTLVLYDINGSPYYLMQSSASQASANNVVSVASRNATRNPTSDATLGQQAGTKEAPDSEAPRTVDVESVKSAMDTTRAKSDGPNLSSTVPAASTAVAQSPQAAGLNSRPTDGPYLMEDGFYSAALVSTACLVRVETVLPLFKDLNRYLVDSTLPSAMRDRHAQRFFSLLSNFIRNLSDSESLEAEGRWLRENLRSSQNTVSLASVTQGVTSAEGLICNAPNKRDARSLSKQNATMATLETNLPANHDSATSSSSIALPIGLQQSRANDFLNANEFNTLVRKKAERLVTAATDFIDNQQAANDVAQCSASEHGADGSNSNVVCTETYSQMSTGIEHDEEISGAAVDHRSAHSKPEEIAAVQQAEKSIDVSATDGTVNFEVGSTLGRKSARRKSDRKRSHRVRRKSKSCNWTKRRKTSAVKSIDVHNPEYVSQTLTDVAVDTTLHTSSDSATMSSQLATTAKPTVLEESSTDICALSALSEGSKNTAITLSPAASVHRCRLVSEAGPSLDSCVANSDFTGPSDYARAAEHGSLPEQDAENTAVVNALSASCDNRKSRLHKKKPKKKPASRVAKVRKNQRPLVRSCSVSVYDFRVLNPKVIEAKNAKSLNITGMNLR